MTNYLKKTAGQLILTLMILIVSLTPLAEKVAADTNSFQVNTTNKINPILFDSINQNKIFMEVADYAPNLNTIESEVTDPNFNVQRNNGMNTFGAIFLVGACLVLATIAPFITWKWFSKKINK